MSREDLVAVGSRLFAVFLAVYALRLVATLFQILATNGFTSGAVIGFAFVLLLIFAVAALLWLFPLTVARQLLPVMKEPRSEDAIGQSIALSLALTAIGFWFLANAIVDCVYWVVLLVQVRASDIAVFELDPTQKANMVATGAQLLVALWLIFGSTGIKRVVERFKYAGDAQSGA